MSYGQDFPDFFRRAVAYIDKILQGTKPADLLFVNLKTANALGATIPQSLLLSTDEVIE